MKSVFANILIITILSITSFPIFANNKPYENLLLLLEEQGLSKCAIKDDEYKGCDPSYYRGECRNIIKILENLWKKHPIELKIVRLFKRILIEFNGMKWFRGYENSIMKTFDLLYKHDIDLAEQIGMELWNEMEDKSFSRVILLSVTPIKMKKDNLITISKNINRINSTKYEDSMEPGNFIVKSKKRNQKDWIEFIKESKCEEAIKLLPSIK